MAHREIIRDNLSTLCELTSLYRRFLVKCEQEKVLVREEVENIELENAVYQRNRVFYEMLRKKDEGTFQKAVELMRHPDAGVSGDIIKILDKSLSASTGSSQPAEKPKRAVKPNDTHWIIKHFMEDVNMVAKKELFYNELGLHPARLSEVLRTVQMSGSSDYSFFSRCLSTWISENGSKATFLILDQVLRDLKLIGLADTVAQDPKAS